MAGVNKYWIDENNMDDGSRNVKGYRSEGGEDAADALRIDNVTVRESQIHRLGELRANRDKNEVREALNHLKRSSALYKYDYNNGNVINNSRNGDGNVGGRRREDISTSRAIIPRIY